MVAVFMIQYFTLQAQSIERFNSFSYSVNEGLLQTTLNDMEFDKNNFCWISFPNGIQKFDGKTFTMVPIQEGLPDDKFIYFFKCKNGDLLLSHSQGISKYDIDKDKFRQVYRFQEPVKGKMRFIGEDENILYLYDEAVSIIGLDTRTFEIVSKTNPNFFIYSTGEENLTKVSDNIINHRAAFMINSKLYLWDLKKQVLVSRSDSIPAASLYFLHLKTSNEVLYYTYKINTALQAYNFSTKSNTLLPLKGKKNEYIGLCAIHDWKGKKLISFNGNLYETDSGLQVLKSELVNFQNKPFVETQNIGGIREDYFGNLYLLTVTAGIRKVIRNNYPVKYYGTDKKEDNNSMSILPDKINNRVFIGTFSRGLLVFDTLQNLVKQIKTLPGTDNGFTLNTIIKNNKGDYLLFIQGQRSVWQLSKNLSQLKPLKITTNVTEEKRGIQFFGTPLFRDEKGAIALTQSMLYKINFTQGQITEHKVTQYYTMGGLKFGNNIITHANDQLVFLDAETIQELKKVPFKNTGNVRCFAKDADNYIYMGSNNGIFKIDSTGKILQHLNTSNGLPDNCIYAIAIDRKGNLWCSCNRGIFRINKDGSILQLKKEDGLQENEFNTNTVAIADDGEFFFGGVNGVSSFYSSEINSFNENIKLLVSNILVNNEVFLGDRAVWDIKKINLPYNKNSVSFDFVAMGNSNPDQYIYQYKMEGIDNVWLEKKDLQPVRYSLPPGNYILKLYASRVFNKDAKPLKEIHIIIGPPFWKTWWFLSSLSLLVIGFIVYLATLFSKRKYEIKLNELENEHKIQLERERISRDLHDSVGAYANAVLYNTELLQKEEGTLERKELMNDLRFASKDIITSLRETVWALKKKSYTAEECFLRIRNFIQPLARYYPNIQFVVEGKTSSGIELNYVKALNVVRIIQEAVTNAIKHSAPDIIKIQSSEKNTRWLLEVSNNGNGFNYDEIKSKEEGNGLKNMQLRAKDSGFEIHIESEKTSETKISLLI